MPFRRLRHAASVLSGATLLFALLLFLLIDRGHAQEPLPILADVATDAANADSQNFQLLGVYAGPTGFVGEAINVSVSYAYVYLDEGLQVVRVFNPSHSQSRWRRR